jgi:hypothetical protein
LLIAYPYVRPCDSSSPIFKMEIILKTFRAMYLDGIIMPKIWKLQSTLLYPGFTLVDSINCGSKIFRGKIVLSMYRLFPLLLPKQYSVTIIYIALALH